MSQSRRTRLLAGAAAAALAVALVPAVADSPAPAASAQPVVELGGFTVNGMPIELALAGLAISALAAGSADGGLETSSATSSGEGAGVGIDGLTGSLDAGSLDGSLTGSESTQDLRAIAQQQLDVINAERRRVGVPEVQWDDAKYAEALAWSEHLAAIDDFHHDTDGFYYWNFGENIAAGSDPHRLMDGFIAERTKPAGQRGHWESLTHEPFRYAAVGIAEHPTWGYVATLVLGVNPGAAPQP